jgi:hypothetical protein
MTNSVRIALGAAWLALAGLHPVAAQQEATPCFALKFEWRTESADSSGWEEHEVEAEYRSMRFGDPHGFVIAGREDDCNIAGMRPGQTRRFPLAWLQGSATAVMGSDRGTTSVNGPPPAGDGSYVAVERKEQGATFRFGIESVPTDSEPFGACGSQIWQPWPPLLEITEQEIADFGNIHKALQLTMPLGDNNCVGSGVATLTIASKPGAQVSLEGCSEFAVGQQATVIAKGSPAGGAYRFRVEPPSTLNVAEQGATATISGIEPGRATLHVEYAVSGGKLGRASRPVTSLRIDSINGGEPVPKIGLFDVEGKRTSAVRSVPVSVQPAGAGDLLAFKPADPGVLTTVGRGDSVLLQGVRVGKTNFQAITSCGGATGPAVAVEVVPCDDEVHAKLAEEERIIDEELKRVAQEDERIRTGKEFQDAERIGELADDLTIKTGGLIIATLAGPAGKSVQTAANIYSHGSNVRDGLKGNVGTALLQTALMAGNQAVAAAVAQAYDTKEAATRLGNAIGSAIGVADRLAANAKQQDHWLRLKEDLVRRKKICRTGGTDPSEGEPPRKSDEPTSEEDPTAPLVEDDPTAPLVEEDDPTESLIGKDPPVPTEKPPAPAEAPPGDPEPDPPSPDAPPERPPLPPPQPGPSGQAAGLPYGEQDCGCTPGGQALGVRAEGLEQIGKGLATLQKCVEQFSGGPLTQYQAALGEWKLVLGEVEAAGANQAVQSSATDALISRLDSLLARTKEFDEKGSLFHAGFESCPAALDSAVTVLKTP